MKSKLLLKENGESTHEKKKKSKTVHLYMSVFLIFHINVETPDESV